jgi:Fur family ferric uptake transcriptional regulator
MTRTPRQRLAERGLEPTRNRTLVLDAVLQAEHTVTPPELLATLGRAMNKVTLYRILDLLVERGLIERHSGAGRAYHYCSGSGHGHFHCTRCGRMRCLHLPEGTLDMALLAQAAGGSVESVELRLDGVCDECARAGA